MLQSKQILLTADKTSFHFLKPSIDIMGLPLMENVIL